MAGINGMELARAELALQTLRSEREEIRVNCDMAALTEAIRAKLSGDALVVLWQMHSVIWGRWNSSELVFKAGVEVAAPYIEEIRVFNESEELRLTREDSELVGRYVCDRDGEGTRCIDSFSRFWGTKDGYDAETGMMLLKDAQRKLQMEVPWAADPTGIDYLGLVVRSYVESEENTGISGYGDYRFVKVDSAQEVG